MKESSRDKRSMGLITTIQKGDNSIGSMLMAIVLRLKEIPWNIWSVGRIRGGNIWNLKKGLTDWRVNDF